MLTVIINKPITGLLLRSFGNENMELPFSYYLSHNILILKLLVYLEFFQISILNNLSRNDFSNATSPDDLLIFIRLWYF